MKFSLWVAPFRPWQDVKVLAEHCDVTGWDGIWVADHFIPDNPELDPPEVAESWAMLGALAQLTKSLNIGSLVSSVTYRHPAVLAAAALTCQQISGGRFTLGLGAGWYKEEHQAFGFEFKSVGKRSDLLEDAAEAVRSLLAGDMVSGPLGDLRLERASLSAGSGYAPPALLIGGRGLQRTLRTAARFADKWNSWADAHTFTARLETLEQHCVDAGRDIAEIECSTQAFLCFEHDSDAHKFATHRYGTRPHLVGSNEEIVSDLLQLQEAGVDELVIPDWNFKDCHETRKALDRFINEIAPNI